MQTNTAPATGLAGEYHGHESRAHWNVCLWLFNDEPLYRMMREHVRAAVDRYIEEGDEGPRFDRLTASALEMATQSLFTALAPSRTPDGYFYTPDTIREAIREEIEERAAAIAGGEA